MNGLSGNIPFWFGSKENLVSLYSSVRISRNFPGLNFPSHPEFSPHRQVNDITERTLLPFVSSGQVTVTDLSKETHSALFRLQRFRIIPAKNAEALSKMKLFYHDELKTFILTNYMDHLTFFSHAPGSDISSAYKNCSKTVKLFGKNSFAEDGKGNYLTSSLNYFGTGLKCFSVLTVPCLKLKGLFENISGSLEMNRIERTDFFSTKENDFLTITNKDSFSGKEKDIVSSFEEVLGELKNASVKTTWSKSEIAEAEKDCTDILNSEFMTFSSLIRCYLTLSALKYAGERNIPVPELNAILAESLYSSAAISSETVLKKELQKKLISIFNNSIKKQNKRNKK
jgi:protein-arginine kinase